MFGWFRRFGRLPLTGAPAIRRQKTYSAQSGYVYQYVYEGRRPLGRLRCRGVEYAFSVSADRRHSLSVSVLISNRAVRAWEQAHGRALTPTEWYAAAKMRLFETFDRRSAPEALPAEIPVRAAHLEAILERLGLA